MMLALAKVQGQERKNSKKKVVSTSSYCTKVLEMSISVLIHPRVFQIGCSDVELEAQKLQAHQCFEHL
jgi:hypothetical protein